MLDRAGGASAARASLLRNARPEAELDAADGDRRRAPAMRADARMGFMGGSFNTREFFHGRRARSLRAVKWVFLLLAFALPAAAARARAAPSGAPALLAAGLRRRSTVGLLAERWFFFAQANHPQNLYYQAVALSGPSVRAAAGSTAAAPFPGHPRVPSPKYATTAAPCACTIAAGIGFE
ncbi:MAG: hypothetical protein MZV65_33225 [Chromatiales bacterium]|nr:hypothetical protein [Chromatiales bacterium]